MLDKHIAENVCLFAGTLSTGTVAIPLMKAFSHYRSLVYTNQMYFDVTNDNGNVRTFLNSIFCSSRVDAETVAVGCIRFWQT